MLYHEATFVQSEKERAKKTMHSTAQQAAKIANLSGVSKLFIGHLSARYDNAKEHLKEARAIFAQTYEAVEGEIIVISK